VVRIPAVAAMVIAIDLVLDPGAVALGFWVFESGAYYGVPAINYAGWVLSAVVATALIDVAFDGTRLLDRVSNCAYMLDDMVSFVLLWGTINVFYRAWIPAAIAALLGLSLLRLDRFDFDITGTVPGL
ncbi:MAG: carotenoid biosynthesis protein, partial [Halovenus sp.]